MKMTFQPKKRSRSKVHGFRKRMSTANGRKVLSARRAKGRKVLSAQAADYVAFYYLLFFEERQCVYMNGYESLKKNSDFSYVYKNGKSYANKYLVMYVIENRTDMNRVGISVSKKVGNSIVRHRLTRIIRESVRLNGAKLLYGYDIVIIARANLKGKGYAEAASAFMHLCGLHGIVDCNS